MTDDTASTPSDIWSALVVEDDPEAGAFTRTVLEKRAGMRVVLEEDADAALAALRAENFDLVVIDVELPGLSGLQILPQAPGGLAWDPGHG